MESSGDGIWSKKKSAARGSTSVAEDKKGAADLPTKVAPVRAARAGRHVGRSVSARRSSMSGG